MDDELAVYTERTLHTRSKTEHTAELIIEGRNITTTHQAFLFYTPSMLEAIRRQHYTLLIDESIQTLSTVKMKNTDLRMAVDAGLIKDNGYSYSIGKPDYDGELFRGFVRLLKSRDLVKANGRGHGKASQLYFWSMPIDLILAFDEVIIMTYMFEGSDMYYLFKMNDISYMNIGIRHDDTGYHFDETITHTIGRGPQVRGLIHICDNKALNAIGEDYHALSASKYRKNPKLADEMNSNLRSYFTYRLNTESHGDSGRRRLY